MIIVMNPNAPQASIDRVVGEIEKMGGAAHLSQGKFRTVIGAVGEEGNIDQNHLAFPHRAHRRLGRISDKARAPPLGVDAALAVRIGHGARNVAQC